MSDTRWHLSAPPGAGKTHVASVMAARGHHLVLGFDKGSAWVEDKEFMAALKTLEDVLAK